MFEVNSMEKTSFKSIEQDGSAVMEIENVSSGKKPRSCIRKNQVESEDEDSVKEEK